TGNLGAVQAAGHAHLHAEGSASHGAHHCALHCTAEHHALLDLLRNAVGDELRIQLGLADLGDVEAHVADGHAEELRRLLAQLLDVLALLADHDAGTRGLDRDVDLLRGALDLNAAHRRLGQPAPQELADAEVGVHMRRELLPAGEPARAPVARDAEPDADRIDLLTHALILLAVAYGDGDVTVALDDARTAALGPRGEALEHRGCIHVDEGYFQLVDVGAVVVLRIGHGGREHFANELGALLRHVL